FLALGHDRAVAGRGKERGDPCSAGTQPLGQRPLRVELELELARKELALELLVLANIGRNHLADLPGAQQEAEAEAIDAGIVRNRGQPLHARVAQCLNERLWNATQAKTTDRQGLVVRDDAIQRRLRVGVELALG